MGRAGGVYLCLVASPDALSVPLSNVVRSTQEKSVEGCGVSSAWEKGAADKRALRGNA